MMVQSRCRWWLLCLLLLSCSVWADPLLWQVDDPKSGGRAYLFGSIHFGDETLYPLPGYVQHAFAQPHSLVVELDMSSVSFAEASHVLAQSGRLPAGERLRDKLDAGQWSELEQISLSLGMPVTAFGRMKPWLVAVQLTASQIRRSGFSERLGVDKHLLDRYKHERPDGEIIELETFSEQMSLFDELSDQEEMAFLQQTLTEFHDTPLSLMSILEAWKTGDEAALVTLISGAFEHREDNLFRRIFTDRNAMMLAKVADRLQQGEQLFVVVGAGHIVGEDGLKARLENSGYQVKSLHSQRLQAPEKTAPKP